ncbi:V-set and immunoglobulin domain-containing protein 8-like [Leptodactylus fuscus]|uniref:V-set and immunoglobulin domain-containing protein 8-like n=1 Tax=Leptodactylus fuscus TaxID=238119 RepID=UPI003F4E49EF
MGDLWTSSWIILGFMPALLDSMTILEPSTETVVLAKGNAATLGCTYVLDPVEIGNVFIMWYKINPDTTELDTVLLSYASNYMKSYAPPSLKNRLSFTAADPGQGDASILITHLKVTDSGTYQCNVKNNPGVASRRITLIVEERPRHPRCFIKGKNTKGRDVILKCRPRGGTPPLKYKWQKISGPLNPTTPDLNSTPVTGDLLIRNISKAYEGAYQCTVGNKVGTATCVVHLHVCTGEEKIGHIQPSLIKFKDFTEMFGITNCHLTMEHGEIYASANAKKLSELTCNKNENASVVFQRVL